MFTKTILTALLATLALSLTACNHPKDTGARNISVPEGTNSGLKDKDSGQSGMTGSTTASDLNDDNPAHSQKRNNVQQGAVQRGKEGDKRVTPGAGQKAPSSPGNGSY